MSNVIQTLRERGLLQDITDPALEELCQKKSLRVYIGFDPTARSLHAGSLVQLITLRHFQQAGHQPIAVAGGGTGMIGDPSGRSEERNLLDDAALEANLNGIRKNMESFLSFEGENAAILVNNADWLRKLGFIEFLRDVGKHFRVNEMVTKESVKRRLEDQSGISFTEFSYQLLQAYDFWYLFKNYECAVQAGGSDQWGNITAGAELIRRTLGGEAFGVTTPLLLDSQGRKMGKTQKGAVWLDPEMLSPYEFYQYWVRQEDADIERFLKMLTFLPLPEIATIVAEHQKAPESRSGQKRLAFEMTSLVHGEAEARKASEAADAIYSGALSGRSDDDLRSIFQDAPGASIPRAELDAGIATADLLVRVNLVPSKKEAKRLLQQGGVYLNNSDSPLDAEKRQLGAEDLASDSMMILRAGKKNYCLVSFE